MSLSLWVYPALIATSISVIGLTRLVWSGYNRLQPRTLSEMVTTSSSRMSTFRWILYPCSVLFGITIVAHIAPHTSTSLLIIIFGLMMCLSEMVLAALPAHGQTLPVHNVFGYIMGSAMVILATLFGLNSDGFTSLIEWVITGAMAALFIGMLWDRKHFVFYELAYIYSSHLSIVIMAIGILEQ